MNKTKGFVYAATGKPGYTELAIRSARSLKAQCPDYPIDLYTDKPVDCDVFDQVHVYEESWFRAKIDALHDSRFDQTVYIDSDTFVIDDISDIFFVLERYDIALTHDQGRNSPVGQAVHSLAFPQSFPTFNGGLIAVNNGNSDVLQLLKNWKSTLLTSGASKDQPSLRELLWGSKLHIAVLPPEYNIMHLHWLDSINYKQAIPKVIHSPKLHRSFTGKYREISSLTDLLGAYRTWKIFRNRSQARHISFRPVPGDIIFGSKPPRGLLSRLYIRKLKRLLSKSA